ncbi:MAG: hypothetical protein ACK559_17760, partial [bacterium]
MARVRPRAAHRARPRRSHGALHAARATPGAVPRAVPSCHATRTPSPTIARGGSAVGLTLGGRIPT